MQTFSYGRHLLYDNEYKGSRGMHSWASAKSKRGWGRGRQLFIWEVWSESVESTLVWMLLYMLNIHQLQPFQHLCRWRTWVLTRYFFHGALKSFTLIKAWCPFPVYCTWCTWQSAGLHWIKLLTLERLEKSYLRLNTDTRLSYPTKYCIFLFTCCIKYHKTCWPSKYHNTQDCFHIQWHLIMK